MFACTLASFFLTFFFSLLLWIGVFFLDQDHLIVYLLKYIHIQGCVQVFHPNDDSRRM